MKCWKCKEELMSVEVTRTYCYMNTWVQDEFRGAKCENCGASLDFDPLETCP